MEGEITFVKNPLLENPERQDQSFEEYRVLNLSENYRSFLSLFVVTPLVLYLVGRVGYFSKNEPTGSGMMFVR